MERGSICIKTFLRDRKRSNRVRNETRLDRSKKSKRETDGEKRQRDRKKGKRQVLKSVSTQNEHSVFKLLFFAPLHNLHILIHICL